jgi:hypothetical protein
MMGIFNEVKVSNAKEFVVPGVVGIFDETTKVCYVDYYDSALNGVFILTSRWLGNNLGALKKSGRFIDENNLSVKVIAMGPEIDYIIAYRNSVNKLIADGWLVVNEINVPECRVTLKYRNIASRRRYYVILETKRKSHFVVGVFHKLSEAESFIKVNYSEQSVTKKIVMDNDLTKEYLERFGEKLPKLTKRGRGVKIDKEEISSELDPGRDEQPEVSGGEDGLQTFSYSE